MRLFERIAFNVLCNTALSFLAGLLVVSIAIKLWRIKTPGPMLYLYSLPFIKVIFDIVRGIPSRSYVWSDLNFDQLPAHMQGFLSARGGFSWFGPIIAVRFGINERSSPDAGGPLFSVSAADILYTWLKMHLGAFTVSLLFATLLSVALVRVTVRISTWLSFEHNRLKDRKKAQIVAKMPIRARTVDIYQSCSYEGSPFTGGVLNPYICFPSKTYETLSGAERKAVIGHEMAHVRHFDILQSMTIAVLGDLFWFVPFYRHVERKVNDLREIVADHVAIRRGAGTSELMTALMKIAEIKASPPVPALYSAFSRKAGLIALRISSLAAEAQPVARTRAWFRPAILVLVSCNVMVASLGGNYQVESYDLKPTSWLQQTIESWIQSLHKTG